ncbi:MAG: hypothetical protein ABEI27_10905 [Halobellus sp.]
MMSSVTTVSDIRVEVAVGFPPDCPAVQASVATELGIALSTHSESLAAA